MSQYLQEQIGEITDEDVEWVEQLLKLPTGAFSGEYDNNARRDVLKSLDSIDVEACPGSGKTTLVVAKLAILARKWNSRISGLCVLSHTNVARNEIEKRLSGGEVGRKLLNYPHFVGTIHAFVNEFLAIPWLRSNGFNIKAIDDSICLSYRWNRLLGNTRYTLANRHYGANVLKIKDEHYGVGILSFGEETPSYQNIRKVCKQSSKDGYFCHDEMLIWSKLLLEQSPEIIVAIRCRFPFLFIDEVQDDSEPQSFLLAKLFHNGECPVVRQRFGDSNQAIYQPDNQQEVETDCFPDQDIRIEIPNSHRFHQQIADLVKPFGATTIELTGCGPNRKEIRTDATGKSACFLFDDLSISYVLKNYAQYLVDVFEEDELERGKFTAVGARLRDKKDDNIPRILNHYWEEFDHELSRSDSQPNTFLKYVYLGEKQFLESGENHHRIDGIARGIIRGAMIANPKAKVQRWRRPHRYILDLCNDSSICDVYVSLVDYISQGTSSIKKEMWSQEVIPLARKTIEHIASTTVNDDGVTKFLDFTEDDPKARQGQQPNRKSSDNVFHFPEASPKVKIQLGSIHSVKGETHTATLVLETYYRAIAR